MQSTKNGVFRLFWKTWEGLTVIKSNEKGGEIVEKERKIRLSPEEFETLLRDAKLMESDEAVRRVWIEPGELVIEIVR